MFTPPRAYVGVYSLLRLGNSQIFQVGAGTFHFLTIAEDEVGAFIALADDRIYVW